MRPVWLLLFALVGCYGPTVPEGAPCTTTSQCPAPQVCDVDTCRWTPLPGDGATDVAVFDGPDNTLIDASGPPVCAQPVLLGAFSAPILLDSLAANGLDGTPTVTSDQLEMYFKSSRSNGAFFGDIWRTTRANSLAAWAAPTIVAELNAAGNDGSPDLSADRLTMYISSDRAGGQGSNDIWKSTRATTSSPWSAPVVVPELSSTGGDEGFTVLPSGLVGYLHSDRASSNSSSYSLFRTTRSSVVAAWSTPVLVPEFGLTGSYENPAVTADDCVIYFNSDRPGSGGSGDIWVAARTTPTAAWGTPANLTTINSSAFDADPWVSADQRYIVFATTATTGSVDLHEARR